MELTLVKKYIISQLKNWVLIFFLMIITLGCLNNKKNIIHYKFKGTEVSRCDANKKSYFLYGKCNSEVKIIDGASVIIDWQFDDFLNALLIFHEDGTVEILKNGGGEFSATKGGGKIFFKRYESPEHNRITQKYFPPNRFHNLFRLSDNLEFEAKTNRDFGSDIIADYAAKQTVSN